MDLMTQTLTTKVLIISAGTGSHVADVRVAKLWMG